MKKSIIATSLILSSIYANAFDLKSIASDVAKNVVQNQTSSNSNINSNLDNSTISNGLKEALKTGVNYAVSSLGKDGGYLNNSDVKIPLPNNLQNAEKLIRKASGDKMVDDLILSMNSAASKAAPKTADIFMDAISKMSLDDAQKILSGNDTAATDYFRNSSTKSLQNMIKPIIEESMKDNNVYQYYDMANSYYQKSDVKNLVNNSSLGALAKNLGADSYIPGNSDESLDDFITNKAIDGLFTLIAEKEASIRENPIEQTSSILKQVFGR